MANYRNQLNLKEFLFVQEPPQEVSFPMNGKEDYVNYVKRYIKKNYKRKLYLNDIAQEMNLSRSYLSTVFNQITGCSFQEYLSDFRIKKAVELMYRRDIPLYMLAEMVGYEDYAHFSKVFKKKTGISPKRFAG